MGWQDSQSHLPVSSHGQLTLTTEGTRRRSISLELKHVLVWMNKKPTEAIQRMDASEQFCRMPVSHEALVCQSGSSRVVMGPLPALCKAEAQLHYS